MKSPLHTHAGGVGLELASLMTQAMRRGVLAVLAVALSCTACGTARGQQLREESHEHGKDRAAPMVQLPRLESFAVPEAPSIDGRADDLVWSRAGQLQVMARVVWPEPEDRSVPVVIKSVHTGAKIYFLVRWKDATKDNDSHKPWVWNAEKKTYEEGPDREDMFALAFEHTGVFDADMLSGQQAVWDIWHWKSTRTNPQRYAMDKSHHYTLEKPSGKAKSYQARNGKRIWIARPEDAGDTIEKKQPAPTEYQKDQLPQYLPGTPNGSAADVRAKGSWADGWWTLELERKLDTGQPDDTVFDTSRTYRMAVSAHDRTGDMDKASGVIELTFVASLPADEISRVTGVEGTLRDGEYKIAVPQNDLDVKVDGFAIIPPMGTTSWVVFMPMASRAMIMGDLVLLEDEFQPVQKVLFEGGLQITAIHNHFLRDTPKVMFMHVGGSGEPLALARAVRMVLDKVADLRRAKGLAARERSVSSTLHGDALSRILGHPGKSSAGVYKIVVGRPDVELRDMGVPVTTFSGFNTWMAFQGTPERAAVAGDFTMLAHEVGPVIQALAAHDIEVTAVHNHMVHEEPRVFFLHFWGVAGVENLARGLRAALDAQAKAATGRREGEHGYREKAEEEGARAMIWRFDDTAVGKLPECWKAEGTNQRGPVATWVVRADASAPSKRNVLALTDTKESSGGTFNLCWTDRVKFKDGVIEVKVKRETGREDQGGGPIWRVQNKNNYYIARWNPLEDNFRLYYVKDGRRVQLDSARVKVDPAKWHTIRIDQKGDEIECYLDGKVLLKVQDRTFPAAGGVGLWTKADAATWFDDLIVDPETR